MTLRPRDSDLTHIDWAKDLGLFDKVLGKNVIDLGCGSGYFCELMVTKYGAKSATGVDIVPINMGQERSQLKFFKTDLDGDWLKALNGETFDIIFSFDILEHLRSPWDFLVNCRRCLANEGVLVLTTPNALSWERYIRPKSWSGVRDQQHKVLFTSYSLDFLLSRVGFSSEVIAPIRKLKFLGPLAPQIGGQLVAVCKP